MGDEHEGHPRFCRHRVEERFERFNAAGRNADANDGIPRHHYCNSNRGDNRPAALAPINFIGVDVGRLLELVNGKRNWTYVHVI